MAIDQRREAEVIRVEPVQKAMVPADSHAAARIVGANYDEFQEDVEIWEVLQQKPDNILRITMAHCDVDTPDAIMQEGSPHALDHALENMTKLLRSELTATVVDVLWVYEIKDVTRPNVRQIGLGGMFDTAQIRTDSHPQGTIIRNEGINDAKVQGRISLVEKTQSLIGVVNMAIEDAQGQVQKALVAYADAHPSDLSTLSSADHCHSIWLVRDPQDQAELMRLFQAEDYAYVADGNHRSMAAARLGIEQFLGVCFPAASMGLAPYNRLVKSPPQPVTDLAGQLRASFEVELLGDLEAFQPASTNEIGLYHPGGWLRLIPKPGTFDEKNAVQAIAADIVQRNVFDRVFGLEGEQDARISYVGGNKDSRYLKRKVDEGAFAYAVSLAPVTMDQFMAVCRQNRFMPRKSTWFSPKVRSGFVIALLEKD